MWEELQLIILLNSKGYTEDYQWCEQGVVCLKTLSIFSFDEFELDEVHHYCSGIIFQEYLDVCALTHSRTGVKGLLIIIHSQSPLDYTNWHKDFRSMLHSLLPYSFYN